MLTSEAYLRTTPGVCMCVCVCVCMCVCVCVCVCVHIYVYRVQQRFALKRAFFVGTLRRGASSWRHRPTPSTQTKTPECGTKCPRSFLRSRSSSSAARAQRRCDFLFFYSLSVFSLFFVESSRRLRRLRSSSSAARREVVIFHLFFF